MPGFPDLGRATAKLNYQEDIAADVDLRQCRPVIGFIRW
jgi:hypothetical protein